MTHYCNIGAAATLLPLLITLLVTTNIPTTESVNTTAANHSSNSGRKCSGVAGCTVAGGGSEEFLMMDSQTATWFLNSLQANTQKLSYKGLKRPPVCDARRAGSCVGEKVNGKKNCNFLNRSCVRP